MSASNPGPMFMMAVAIAFSFGIAYIAHRGVNGSTSVNVAINVIQISALLVFSVMALGYRMNHPPGSQAYQFDSASGDAYTYEFATEKQTVNGQPTDVILRDSAGVPKPKLDAAGKPVPFQIAYPEKDEKGNFLSHPTAGSVTSMHNFGWMFVQATIAILILVGFESVTAMGGEAKNPKRHIPIAVVTSLLVQGAFCYLIEYFAANYFLNSGYTMQNAVGSAAPIGDMMVVVGNAILGPGNGRIFMEFQAFTVFLAIIGTTLSCMNTGARVTYAMGKDEELPDSMGKLHARNLTPHRAIWLLAGISAVVGCVTVSNLFGDAGALTDATIKALPQGFWSSFGYLSSRPDGRPAEFSSHGHPGFQLRHVRAVRAELRYLYGRVPQPSQVQSVAPLDHPGIRALGEPGVHGVLPDRAVHGIRHQIGTAAGARRRPGVGGLRRCLLHPFEQSHRTHHSGGCPLQCECRIVICTYARS